MTVTVEQILSALSHVRYPGKEGDVVSLGMVQAQDILLNGREVTIGVHFPKQRDPFAKSVVKAIETAVLTYVSADMEVKGRVTPLFPEEQSQVKEEQPLQGVRNVIAVFSGKGGVGKSTITANLAVALARAGYKVGLLDADVYGPSMPKMFACEDARPVLAKVGGKDLIEPIEVEAGVKLLSIGFFVNPEQALLWRGTMASNALSQLIRDGNWGELDYFLLDMPPGTGDIHLTLVQNVSVTGAVVVTTPQQVALADAVKGINMFREDNVNVPVLGLVENMAWFTPAELPQNKYYIFGKEGGVALAREMGIELLGQIPLVQSVCASGDEGRPIAADEESPLRDAFASLANRVVAAVEERNQTLAPTQKVEITKR
ncbi:MAG: Mrp/NBP35 family ATP-binding protein [Porphyromonas sp.]|nr:Mrp/NBP35 family ATP-binding protein [Porphyromonas sp.]